ncbi:hypothetical protein SynA1560_02718 [Synechococcus sp. A15-60]|nr:hypothetical protein SynA1560_02718 [Synechococcus sp. A15-60]
MLRSASIESLRFPWGFVTENPLLEAFLSQCARVLRLARRRHPDGWI